MNPIAYKGLTKDEFEKFIKSSFKLMEAKYQFTETDVNLLVKNRFKLKNGRITKK